MQDKDSRKAELVQKRMEELDKIIQRLYEDSVLGKLSDARYMKLSVQYETEQAEIGRLAKALEQEIESEAGQTADVGRFLQLANRYSDLQELDAVTVNELIERSVIHSPEKISGKKYVTIEVYITYVGKIRIPLSKSEPLAATEKCIYFLMSLCLFFGIFSGYYVVQMICAVFVYGVSTLLPDILGVMKYVGAAYILWLAGHIAFGSRDEEGATKSASFWKGFMLQFVNVKIYLFGITALTGYVTNYSTCLPVLAFFEFVIATIGTVATSVWIGMGLAIQKVYLRHYRLINMILAAVLLECVYSILK